MSESTATRGRKPVPENESKADAFKRLGLARTATALKAIALIGNLASPNYEFKEAQAQAICDALTKEVSKVRAKFANPTAEEAPAFTMPE